MLIALALFVAAAVVYFNFIIPVYGEVKSLRAEQIARQNILVDQKKAVDSITKMRAKFNQQEAEQQKVSEALPPTPSVANLIAQSYLIATFDGMKAENFSVSTPGIVTDQGAAPSIVGPVGTVEMQLRLSGSYDNFKRFLRDLETNIRIASIKSLSITASGKDTDVQYSYQLAVVAYYQVAPSSMQK